MTHICVSNPTIIGSDNGLSPSRRQTIILTNAEILLIGPLGTNFSGISKENLSITIKGESLIFENGWFSLQWRYNKRASVSSPQRLDCLPNRLFRHRSKKNQSSPWLAYVRGIHRWTMNSKHKWPVTRTMFPFHDVIIATIMILGRWVHLRSVPT